MGAVQSVLDRLSDSTSSDVDRLVEWITALKEGECLHVKMEFSHIGSYIVEKDGVWYLTDDEGRSLHRIGAEKLAELTLSERSEVTTHPRNVFPYTDELKVLEDPYQKRRKGGV